MSTSSTTGSATTLGTRAVVIGGGMAGLFAAAAAAQHFGEVVVLDRDDLPDDAAPRKGVPQGNHFHVLLPGGMDAMCEWFPGFADDLVDAGSVEMTSGRDFYVYTPLGKSYNMQSHQPEPMDGETMYVQTRPLLEQCVRRRVLGLPNVSLRHRVVVDAPIVVDGRIAGVTTKDGDELKADLVIDASGRNPCTPRWISAMGFDPVPEQHIGCDIQYVSAIVEPDDWDAFEGVVFFVRPDPDGPYPSRGAAAVKLEGGRWLLMLGGRHGDFCNGDWDSMLEYGDTLLSSAWVECARRSTPVGPVSTYRLPTAIRRRYEQLDRFPDGLLPLGDAICFFNPLYGQGMSSAAGQCRGLREILGRRAERGEGLGGLATEFFAMANEWVRGPWAMAATADLEFEACTGDLPTEELPDLQRFQEIVDAAATRPELWLVVRDLMTLRRPLSAVNEVELAPTA